VSGLVKAPVVLRQRKVMALVQSAGHMLHGHLVEITGRGRGDRVFAKDDGGVELTFSNRELQQVA
jgi:hypothetical protein